MQDQLMSQGIELLVFGMGTVFVFLTVLVLITMLMSFIVQRFFPEAAAVAKVRTARVAPNKQNNDELVAVISAAVHKHRSRQK